MASFEAKLNIISQTLTLQNKLKKHICNINKRQMTLSQTIEKKVTVYLSIAAKPGM